MARRLKKFGDSFKSGPTTKCGRKNLLQKVCSTLGSPSDWSYHPLNLPSTKRSWNLTPTSTRAPAATYRWAQQHFSQSKSMPCAFCTGLKAYLFVEEILTGILSYQFCRMTGAMISPYRFQGELQWWFFSISVELLNDAPLQTSEGSLVNVSATDLGM